LLQILRNPQARHNLESNSRIKIIYDPNTSYNSSDEEEENLREALEASLRTATPPPTSFTSTVEVFFRHGILDYCHDIPNGFYACFGSFPEVADKGEVPLLANLQRCQIVEGRDVILFDLHTDLALATFKAHVLSTAPQNEAFFDRVAWAAQTVSSRLGGSYPDAKLQKQYIEYSAKLQARHGSVVLTAGELTVRPLPFHTASGCLAFGAPHSVY
jgi:Ethylene-responsive protein kinase Le-CTR1